MHCHRHSCVKVQLCMCSNKWYTRARLLLRRGYNAYQANELNAEKITTFSDHLNYEAVVQVFDSASVLTCTCMLMGPAAICTVATRLAPDLLFHVSAVRRDRRQRPPVLQLHQPGDTGDTQLPPTPQLRACESWLVAEPLGEGTATAVQSQESTGVQQVVHLALPLSGGVKSTVSAPPSTLNC